MFTPVFAQILTFKAVRRFDETEDTKRINDVLKELQEKGAKILDVKVALEAGITAVYIITYEATNPLSPDLELEEELEEETEQISGPVEHCTCQHPKHLHDKNGSCKICTCKKYVLAGVY